MAKRPNLNTTVGGYKSAEALNDNFQTLEEHFDSFLSLDGSTPNAMQADLDLDGNDLLNVGTTNTDELYVGGVKVSDATYVPNWEGEWTTGTPYVVNDIVRQDGNVYICLVAHTSGTFSTDLTNNRWELFASKGSAGAGTGDLLAANNLSDVANAATARTNLGLGTVSVENTVPVTKGGTGATTASSARVNLGLGSIATTDIIDEDNMATDSATRAPSQQSVKAYVDSSVSGLGFSLVATSTSISGGAITISGLGDYEEIIVIGDGLTASVNSFRCLQVGYGSGSSFVTSASYPYAYGDAYGSFGHLSDSGSARNAFWRITGFNKNWTVKPIQSGAFSEFSPLFVRNSNIFDTVKIYSGTVLGVAGGNITGGTVYVFGK